MLRRAIGRLLLAGLTTGVLGCSSPAPAPKTSDTSAPAARTAPAAPAKAPEAAAPAGPSSGTGQAAPTGQAAQTGQAAASPTTAAARVEPKGRVVYILDFSFAPTWLDPQENPALLTPYSIQYALHDALVKHLPGKPITPSLAESYTIAPDFKSATFKLREGVKFHNGDPITVEDVKFTYEKYRGVNAKILKDKTERIDTPDPRTITFVFKEPFLDFEILYGSPASSAGWVIPKKYYEQVGPDGFKQQPIGAVPKKLFRQIPG